MVLVLSFLVVSCRGWARSGSWKKKAALVRWLDFFSSYGCDRLATVWRRGFLTSSDCNKTTSRCVYGMDSIGVVRLDVAQAVRLLMR